MSARSVALITGASSGIGEALALEFIGRGWDVALVARRADRLEAVAEKARAAGVTALPIVGDVTRDGDMEKAVEQTVAKFGRLDAAIANAGFGVVGSVEKLSLEDYRRQFETNFYGVLRTAKAVIPALRQSRGRLAFVGSVNGYIALAGNSPYACSKFAVRALSEALRLELRRDGISVTHIAPGFVASEIRQVNNQGVRREAAQDPVPNRLVVPADRAARSIARAVLCRRREGVITGHGKVLVFLERHFPWFISFLLTRFGVDARREAK